MLTAFLSSGAGALIVGAVAYVWKRKVDRQAQAEEIDQRAKVAEEQAKQRESQERRMSDEKERSLRHQNEAEERKADRDRQDAMVAMLQKHSEETLNVLRQEIEEQRKINGHAFEILERNTKSTEIIAQAVNLQTAQLAGMRDEISTLRGTVQVAVAIRQAQAQAP